jgi:hypothetical protein
MQGTRSFDLFAAINCIPLEENRECRGRGAQAQGEIHG